MAEPESFAPDPENVVTSEESVPDDVDDLVDDRRVDHGDAPDPALDHAPDAEDPDGMLADGDLQGAGTAVVEADDHADHQHADHQHSVPTGVERRGSRGRAGRSSRSSHRDQGGLRIRLSDNELRAAQVIQDRFKLRSTVAALGFSLRTMARMIEQGELSDQVTPSLPRSSRGGNAGKERERPGGGAARVRANPFARPPRPQAPPTEAPPAEPQPEAEVQPAGEAPVGNAGDSPANSES